jgi:hypothetical protein
VAFKISAGMAQELYFSDLPPVAYLRASWLETPLYNLLFAGVWLVFALAVIFVWPVSSMTHRHVIAVPGQKFAGLVTYVAILLALVFFIQLAGAVTGPLDAVLHLQGRLAPLLWFPVVLILLAMLQFVLVYRVLVYGYWWVSRRLHYVIMLALQIALVVWFWYWNLLPPVLLSWLY